MQHEEIKKTEIRQEGKEHQIKTSTRKETKGKGGTHPMTREGQGARGKRHAIHYTH